MIEAIREHFMKTRKEKVIKEVTVNQTKLEKAHDLTNRNLKRFNMFYTRLDDSLKPKYRKTLDWLKKGNKDLKMRIKNGNRNNR